MEVTEPISRKLIHVAKVYLNVLSKRVEHLGINRYWYVLSLIHANNGKLTQKALGDKLGKDKSAMVSIIDFLTDRGYVYREVNPNDRREHFLKVTAKAEAAVPEIVAAFNSINNTVAKEVTAEEMETFFKVLFKMEENLKPYANKELNIKLNLNK
ncbi:MarR family transcriptional regulator [Mucilaginibacter yixingensis]|uniref:MarR family transcriptional regulator n=1 Tax=Mucilaginibacter yixingensis TaxID=1295612 RepID=A0A2T5JCY3_9SPHI|nr:MarR family transcriptional regulator [Mucilaginibacter yixingensis]PTQ99628.1 MarR family transcriptional regulator [Mucilaginibacter yixingensis]